MAKYDKVVFRWFNANGATNFTGAVLIRDGEKGSEMVLDIAWTDGGPYLIVGRTHRRKQYFAGRNTARGPTGDVTASWAEVDGAYVGRWIENGVEYLFTFNLSGIGSR